MTAVHLAPIAPPAPDAPVAPSLSDPWSPVLTALPSEWLDSAAFVARHGKTSVALFHLGADRMVLRLAHGGLAGFVTRGRWAVMPGDPVTVGQSRCAIADALDDLMDELDARRLRPVFAAVAVPGPYTARRMYAMPIADEPTISLATFTLSGKRMASLRHSVTSARRTGLQVLPYDDALAAGTDTVSASWLATKRGGEMGFTLGRFDAAAMSGIDCRVAVDGSGRVVGFVTWHRYDDGRGRVLDLMRRVPDAPNPTMDLLVAESLLGFASDGVAEASLGSVPRSHGRIAERVYPTATLRRYKEKFAPTWAPRYLVAPSQRRLLGALIAITRAYCPDGILRAARRNG